MIPALARLAERAQKRVDLRFEGFDAFERRRFFGLGRYFEAVLEEPARDTGGFDDAIDAARVEGDFGGLDAADVPDSDAERFGTLGFGQACVGERGS